MRLIFALVPAAFFAASMLLAWRFPLTEESVRQMRQEPDARQAAAEPVC